MTALKDTRLQIGVEHYACNEVHSLLAFEIFHDVKKVLGMHRGFLHFAGKIQTGEANASGVIVIEVADEIELPEVHTCVCHYPANILHLSSP